MFSLFELVLLEDVLNLVDFMELDFPPPPSPVKILNFCYNLGHKLQVSKLSELRNFVQPSM